MKMLRGDIQYNRDNTRRKKQRNEAVVEQRSGCECGMRAGKSRHMLWLYELILLILLMAEILHHLGCMKPYK